MTPPAPDNCLPDTHIKEGERFLIESRGLDTLVSKLRENNLLRAGVRDNTDFLPLEFSVVRLDRPDMTQGSGSCLYEDAMYLFKVYDHGRPLGHLRVENGFLEVVPEFERPTPLYFHKSSTGGMRIGHRTPDGPLVVAAVYPGMPLSFESPKSGVNHQVFNLIPLWRDINKESERKLMLPTSLSLPFVRFLYFFLSASYSSS